MPGYLLQCNKIVILLAFGVFITTKSTYAELSLPESLQIHGFASLGYFNTSGNNFFGNTKSGGDVDFWELGTNGSWRPLNNLQLSLQVVSRQAGKTDDGDLRIDYGFLDFSFLSDVDNLWGVRLGRVVNSYGLYNDTRDMAFTRPGILLPQSIYFDINRELALSGDGGQLYGERRTSFGDFLLQLQIFQPRVDDPDLKNDLTGGSGGDLDGKPSWGGRLTYEKDGGRLRLALSGFQLNVDPDPNGAVSQSSPQFDLDPVVLSAQYNAERWSLTGEYAFRHLRRDIFVPPLPNESVTGESYYLQAIYRLAQRWEAMLRYDVLYWDKDDRNGKEYEANTGGRIPAYRRFAKDWAIGLRWNITPNMMLRAEYHNINGAGWISSLENPIDDTEQHWYMFAILASYRF